MLLLLHRLRVLLLLLLLQELVLLLLLLLLGLHLLLLLLRGLLHLLQLGRAWQSVAAAAGCAGQTARRRCRLPVDRLLLLLCGLQLLRGICCKGKRLRLHRCMRP